jgi:hypothetical protein
MLRSSVLAASCALLVTSAGATAAASSPLKPLPASFPKPAKSKVLKEHFKGRDHDYLLKVDGNHRALAFWEARLPKHGWTITGVTHLGPFTTVHLHGHGYGRAKTEINFIAKNRAAVLLHRTSS